MRTARRVGRLEQVLRTPPYPVWCNWGPVACLASPEALLPWPAVYPDCGRDTTRVRLIVGVAWESL
ncbi:MAG: hypothetical protein M3Q71_16965 [Chloroflexota bacterium]|nr:hypothetical protein [Chloroflexota bacterium]MDP9472332.1 hypothetical protein [Chloroflexota bacterium]